MLNCDVPPWICPILTFSLDNLYWIARFLNDYVALWHSSKVMSHWIWLTMIGHGWPWWHWMTMVYCILLCLILLDCDWLWLKMMAIFYHGQHSSMVMLIQTFLIGHARLLLSAWLSYMWKFYVPQWLCYILAFIKGDVPLQWSLRIKLDCGSPLWLCRIVTFIFVYLW
jgi:hypothetical protein